MIYHHLLYNHRRFRRIPIQTPTLKAMRSNRTGRTTETAEEITLPGGFPFLILCA